MQLKGFEMLKAIILDPTSFSIERDLITPTFKLKRPQLLNYYKVSEKFILMFFFDKEQYGVSTGNCTSCQSD
jgi:long-subunit acyl-CoA synthetase (AMP-forming)